MARFKDANWVLPVCNDGNIGSIDGGSAHLAVLMDIRDELKKLNQLLYCHNFLEMPFTLKKIEKNTTKKKPVKRKKQQ